MKLHTVYRVVKGIAREFIKDSCTLRASSLAFTTLLALVPLSATVFSISTAFGAFSSMEEQIKEFLIHQLIPTRQDEILAALERFVENASTLGIVGFTIFAVTSVSLLNGINLNFNAVWGSSVRKGFLRFFTTYTSVIVFGTIFLGASFTFTARARQLLSALPELSWLVRLGIGIAPSLFIFFLFMLMISSIPTGPVLRKSALTGALVGTVLWESAKFGFVRGTNYVLRSSVIYGSIATIPIFLFWLYLAWLIIFIALETSYVQQHRRPGPGETGAGLDGLASRASLSVTVYLACAARFRKGFGPLDADRLALELSLDQNSFYRTIEPLVRDSLLLYEQQTRNIIMPAADLSSVTLGDLMRSVFSSAEAGEDISAVHPLVASFIRSGGASCGTMTVAEYLALNETGGNGSDEV